MPKKNLHLVSYRMLNFTSFLKSKLICIFFGGVACLLAYENLQGNYFKVFFPADAGDFTCLAGFFSLMWEILHASRESGRNSVQAGDSLSMRESWKPWIKLHCLNQMEVCHLYMYVFSFLLNNYFAISYEFVVILSGCIDEESHFVFRKEVFSTFLSLNHNKVILLCQLFLSLLKKKICVNF